jgi:diphosphomevalonate decarboxylase
VSGKATAVAPSNIAFVKYWGTRDAEKTLPWNPSISMTLSECVSRCTVEHVTGSEDGEVLLRQGDDLIPASDSFADPIRRHLDFVRSWADATGGFRVATENSFPTGAGMASSASGFAALTLAAAAALGRALEVEEASILARSSGSGSAARSVLGGFVEWPGDEKSDAAKQLAGADHWPLSDIVAVVSSGAKEVSSREGHRRATSSPVFERRLQALPGRLRRVRKAIVDRDMLELGPVLEEEALELHLVAMSSQPPIFYWTGGTIAVLRRVRELRVEGLQAFSTIDAGPNVHVICPSDQERQVADALSRMAEIESVITDRVGNGPYLTDEHLV